MAASRSLLWGKNRSIQVHCSSVKDGIDRQFRVLTISAIAPALELPALAV
jgi:hypothetical protein